MKKKNLYFITQYESFFSKNYQQHLLLLIIQTLKILIQFLRTKHDFLFFI